jgi:hypothetical protein
VNVRAIGDFLFTSAIVAVIAWAMWAALAFPYEARLLPWVIGLPAALLCLVVLVLIAPRILSEPDSEEQARLLDIQADRDIPGSLVAIRAAALFGWVFGFFAAVWLVGFLPSVPLFVFLYLVIQGRERWWVALTVSVATSAFMIGVFHLILRVAWLRGQFPEPQRLLLDWVNRLF